MYGPDRVLQPAVRDGDKGSGAFRARSWDEALDRVAAAMAAASATFGGESILPFCYGGSNGYLTQDAADARLFRRLGASRLLRTVCAAPTGAAADGALRQDAGRRARRLRARAPDRRVGRATRRRAAFTWCR